MRPTPLHITAAVLVLVGCEFAMTNCWIAVGEVFHEAHEDRSYSREYLVSFAFGFGLMSLLPAWLAIRQYQSMFRCNKAAATTTTVLLIFVAILVTIAFVDFIGVYRGRMAEDSIWWGMLFVLILAWFTVVLNWRWSNQLQSVQTTNAVSPWQFSLGEIIGLVTLFAIQFAIAGFALRLMSA